MRRGLTSASHDAIPSLIARIWWAQVKFCVKAMKRFLLAFAFFFLLAPVALDRGHAGIDLETGALPEGDLELVMVEAEGCIYCALFRRDVMPTYETSKRGKEVPMRFLDINDLEESALETDGPVDLVPTVVLFKDHKEVGRIAGYLGPEGFFHALNRLMTSSD
jgi:thioredoxin-related protein